MRHKISLQNLLDFSPEETIARTSDKILVGRLHILEEGKSYYEFILRQMMDGSWRQIATFPIQKIDEAIEFYNSI